VLCAAASVADTSPVALRPVIAAAFRRAQEIGLDLETVTRALSPPGTRASTKR
jgi:hypothetical protein